MGDKKPLQWHPAFFATIQIELESERKHLIFENEHQLGTKPKEIDVLIIKKEKHRKIRKNIGRFFLEHNIIEYKSPTDYLSIDDYYKVYGYACFYKVDVPNADSIPIDEITITFVCSQMPKKLIKHWCKRGLQIRPQEAGIYYIIGDGFPIQLLITEELSENENLYLRSLTNNLSKELPKKLLLSYGKHKDNKLYESVMDIVVQANQEKFGGDNMCGALEEIMKDKLDEREEMGVKIGMERGMERGIEQGTERGELLRLIIQIQKKYIKGKDLISIAEDLEENPNEIAKLYELVVSQPEKSAKELAEMAVGCCVSY